MKKNFLIDEIINNLDSIGFYTGNIDNKVIYYYIFNDLKKLYNSSFNFIHDYDIELDDITMHIKRDNELILTISSYEDCIIFGETKDGKFVITTDDSELKNLVSYKNIIEELSYISEEELFEYRKTVDLNTTIDFSLRPLKIRRKDKTEIYEINHNNNDKQKNPSLLKKIYDNLCNSKYVYINSNELVKEANPIDVFDKIMDISDEMSKTKTKK